MTTRIRAAIETMLEESRRTTLPIGKAIDLAYAALALMPETEPVRLERRWAVRNAEYADTQRIGAAAAYALLAGGLILDELERLDPTTRLDPDEPDEPSDPRPEPPPGW